MSISAEMNSARTFPGRLPTWARRVLAQPVWGRGAMGEFIQERLLLLHDKPCWRHDRARFRIVVVVNNRRGRLRVQAKARTKFEIEFRATGAGPKVHDHSVGQNVVLTNAPIR